MRFFNKFKGQAIAGIFSIFALTGSWGQSVGLVLSGGGAKGIAHIGVLHALEENNIPIDYVTGTSMGAIVGGLYAAGYSPAEMVTLLTSPGFADWSSGTINPDLIYYFTRPEPSPANINLNLGLNKKSQLSSVLPMSLINPIPMNLAFLELFSPYTAQCGGDFNKLFVPYRCVTSNVYEKHKVVLSDGSLGDAVRMSMSFPVVFHPIDRDGIPMYDGGIYDNYPVDVMMEDFKPQRVIGINVSTPSPPKSRDMLDQVEEMIMQPQDYPFPDSIGINIHMDLEKFSLLDWGACAQIYAIGYKTAMANMDSIKALVKRRMPQDQLQAKRNDWKALTPQVIFDSVTVTGGTKGENQYVRSLFPKKQFGLERLRDDYYRAITPEKLQNLVPYPTYDDKKKVFNLDFNAVVKKHFTLGAGAYLSSSTSSMLYLNGGYSTISHHAMDLGLNLWIGQTYLAAKAKGRFMLGTSAPQSIDIEAVASQSKFHQTEKMFYEVNSPDFVTKSEIHASAAWAIAASQHGRVDAGAGYGHFRDRYWDGEKQHMVFNLGKLFAGYEYSVLDNDFTPTYGSRYKAEAAGVVGGMVSGQSLKWMQLDLQGLKFFPVGKKFSLGTEITALLSTRKLLPGYMASIVAAPAFTPTPSSHNNFNTAFRANSFATAGLVPVVKFGSFCLRGNFHLFLPVRPIECGEGGKAQYGHYFSKPEFFGQIAPTITFPWAQIQAYGNYFSAGSRHWNFGLSIGFFMLAPKFL